MTEVNQTEDQLVQQMAGPMIKAFAAQKKAKKRFQSQNRDAWNRMNRPHKQVLIEAGGTKVVALIARFKP